MDDCIEWAGARHGRGYGCVRIGGRRGRLVQAHRWVWEQANGPIPEGMVVMHTCDNPPCINLGHLRLGTQSENILDMVAKGRRHHVPPTHCVHGHELTDDTTYQYGDGRRHCKQCRKERRARIKVH